jgi:hypothetical protein
VVVLKGDVAGVTQDRIVFEDRFSPLVHTGLSKFFGAAHRFDVLGEDDVLEGKSAAATDTSLARSA